MNRNYSPHRTPAHRAHPARRPDARRVLVGLMMAGVDDRGESDVLAGSADPRVLQANERTLLAWVRTGIALMTFGFVIARIGVWLRALAATQREPELHPFGTAWIGAAFVALGVLANAAATMRYSVTKRAILAGEPIPDDRLPVLFALIVTVLGAVMGAYLLLRLV
jgi:putative membrane protein